MTADSKGFDDYCRRLAGELPVVIISVNYRLAPKHRFPSQYEDGIDALKFIDNSRIKDFPKWADLKRCFVAGDSAGGNLAHNVASLAHGYSFYKLKLIGVIAIQPFFGKEERTGPENSCVTASLVSMERADWLWKSFLPEESNRDNVAANFVGPNYPDNFSGVDFRATIVIVGGFDPLQVWQKRYFEGLKICGKEAYLIEYPNAVHGFYFFP